MATRYELTCDSCGLVVKGIDDARSEWSSRDVAKNNWRIGISNHWLDSRRANATDIAEWSACRQYDAEVCADCAAKAAAAIRAALGYDGKERS